MTRLYSFSFSVPVISFPALVATVPEADYPIFPLYYLRSSRTDPSHSNIGCTVLLEKENRRVIEEQV